MPTINSMAQFVVNVHDVTKINVNPKLSLQKAGITDFFKELPNSLLYFMDGENHKHQFSGLKVNNAEIENIGSNPLKMSVDVDFQQTLENILHKNVVNLSTLHLIALPYFSNIGGISMNFYPDVINAEGENGTNNPLYDYHTALLFVDKC